MRIGAKVHYFNFEMRRRRKELGWTQARLGEESGVGINEVGCIERLLQPRTSIRGANDKLLRIARALETEFEVLFPAEYLALVQRKLLPKRSRPYLWVTELSLDQLPETTAELLLPGGDDVVEKAQMREAVCDVVRGLPPREQRILELRFGLGGEEQMTLMEAGAELGITPSRVMQIQAKALRWLRHSSRSDVLRDYL